MAQRKKTENVETDEPGPTFDQEEVELLERILRKHRTTIPTYLLSMQHELTLIDNILRKLSD